MTAIAQNTIRNRYVKKQGSDRVIPVDHAGILLARVGIDMFECDKDGRPIDSSPTGLARAAKIEGSDAMQPQALPRVSEVSRVRMAPEPPKTAEQLEAEETEKINLIQYAQDRHGVALDPSDSLSLIKTRVKKLNEKAGIVEPKPAKAKRGRKPKA